MRIDQLLNQLCLVKSRSAAARLCSGGNVLLGGQPAKASARVHAGDRIDIQFTSRTVSIEVVTIPAGQVSRARAPEYYRDLSR